MTRLVAGLRRTPKQFQSQTHTKKRSWSLFGGLLLIWSTTDLNPSEAIISEKYAQEIDEMQWKLQRLESALVNRNSPILFHDNTQLHITQPTLRKLNELGYTILPHLPNSPDLSPINYHYFKNLDNFLHGKCSISSRMQKNLSKSLSNPKTWVFMLQEYTNLLLAKVCWWMVPILINKYMFRLVIVI